MKNLSKSQVKSILKCIAFGTFAIIFAIWLFRLFIGIFTIALK